MNDRTGQGGIILQGRPTAVCIQAMLPMLCGCSWRATNPKVPRFVLQAQSCLLAACLAFAQPSLPLRCRFAGCEWLRLPLKWATATTEATGWHRMPYDMEAQGLRSWCLSTAQHMTCHCAACCWA